MIDREYLDRVRASLPAPPPSTTTAEHAILDGVLVRLIRERAVDEGVWSVATRYAYYRAEWDKLHAELVTRESRAAKGHFMSGREQRLAHLNRECRTFEKDLLATPYQRARATGSAQTSFLDDLAPRSDTPPDSTVIDAVSAFRPISRL